MAEQPPPLLDPVARAQAGSSAPRPATAPASARWTLRLLGAVEAESPGLTLARWPTRATATLLARLALQPDRDHPREELVELLWPGVALDVGRNRLRQALSSLRSLLEPRGEPDSPVFSAGRTHIRAVAGALECDVHRFEACLRSGDIDGARRWNRGDFMPGWYDDWVVEERHRLTGLQERIEASDRVLPQAEPEPEPAPAPAPASAAWAVLPPPSGLPSYWTRSFGTELMASRLYALVRTQRLVTVHGPGGSGKTRLAVAVAKALQEGKAWSLAGPSVQPVFERIAFVPLADCSNMAQALDALCLALRAEAVGDPQARIVAALAGRHTLLVLDNLEQLAHAAGGEIAGLLAAAPQLHVLTTSRQLLDVDGEHAFELEGLVLPPAEATLADAATNPAVSLFLDRARAVHAGFALGSRNLGAVVRLVRLLGGMPLAIELAASRMRGHTPRELLQRLSVGAGTPMLDLLARGKAAASPHERHASMRHVVAWSWQQLQPLQAELLQGLSVCTASISPAAAAAVLGIPLQQATGLLEELLDASLLRAAADPADAPDGDRGDLGTRFVLLQPVREYAAERCDEAAARAARSRLRGWLLAEAPRLMAVGSSAVAAEVALVHAALLSAPADGEPHQALALAVALRGHWDVDPLPFSVLLALERSLALLPPVAAPLRSDVHELLSTARGMAGCPAEALVHAVAAVALAPDDRRRSLALTRCAWAHYTAGHFDRPLEPLLDEAHALAQRAGDLHAEATAVRMQSFVACNIRLDFLRAEALSATAQRLWEQLGNRPMTWLSLINRAITRVWGQSGIGDEEAVTLMGECERTARASSDWARLIICTRQLGRIHIRRRRWQPAAAALRRSAQVAWQRHAALGLAHALLHLPMAMAMAGQAEAAARLDGYAVANWWKLFNGINRIEARELRRTRLVLRLALGAARAEALRLEGRGLGPAAAYALAMSEAPAPESAAGG